MTMHQPIRGAASVGTLDELSAWEADFVQVLRLWMTGTEGRVEVWNDFAQSLGPARATNCLNAFERLILLIETHMLRPMARHTVGCRCLGSDEALVLHLVRTAGAGDLHEATAIATLIVRSAHAELLAILAATVGETLRTGRKSGAHARLATRPAHTLH